MFLKRRELLILKSLMLADKGIRISYLTNKFKVSERMIRYDIDNINYFLKSINAFIDKDRNGNFILNIKEEDIAKLKEELNNFAVTDVYLTEEDRFNYIIIKLLTANNPITISSIAEELYVSRSSLNKTMKKVYEWFDEQGIDVISKTNYGILLNCSENKWRKAVIKLSNNKEHRGYFYSLLHKASNDSDDNYLNPTNYILPLYKEALFDEEDLYKIIDSISYLEDLLETKFDDSSYVSLLIHLAIAMKRLKNGNKILMSDEQLEQLKNEDEYSVSKSFAKYLNTIFEIDIPDEEIGYITIHLMGARRFFILANDDKELREVVIKIIDNVQRILNQIIDNKYIDDLIKDLTVHLKPAISRLKNSLMIENPILGTIKGKYMDIFSAVEKSCFIIKEKYDIENIPDDEIAYITMHIGASLEKSRVIKSKKIKAITMCASGLGTSKMLSSRIQREFPMIEIIGEISIFDASKYRKADVIISTIDTYIKTEIPIIRVTPLLDNKDIKKIEDFLDIKRVVPNYEILGDLDNKIDIIVKAAKDNSTDLDENKFKDDLYKILINNNNTGEEILPMLSELIDEKRISFYDAKNWEDAVREAGRLLVNTKCAKNGYVDKMVDTVKELGSYIVITKGIALPHARPEDGALKVAMSLVILNNPINFGNKNNDPVKAVFGLCAVDNHTHLRALSDLGKFAVNEDNFSTLVSLKSKKEISKYIKQICEESDKNE